MWKNVCSIPKDFYLALIIICKVVKMVSFNTHNLLNFYFRLEFEKKKILAKVIVIKCITN